MMRRIWLAPYFVMFAGVAFGQTAELSGLIRDPSDSSVSGAEVSIRNEQTGGRRSTQSNASGFYSFPSLSPGEYRLSIRAMGFETIVREGIRLAVAENARIDFTLRLGDFHTVVTVTGGPPLINTEDASVGTVIDRKIIDQMPLSGRGIQSLIELSPGVVVVPVVAPSGGQFVVNGQRSNSNYITVDGVGANFALASALTSTPTTTIRRAGSGMIPANNFFGTFANLVSPEALQEFKIQTSTFAPEFGRSPGAQIGLVTRSGTNRYSGSLFEYFRNDRMDATDWFANRQGLPKPPLRFSDFGGTLGGPVRIPHLYSGRNRTFFFLSVEDLVMRQPQPAAAGVPVPTLQARLHAPPLVAALLNAYPLPNRADRETADSSPAGFAPYTGSYPFRHDQQIFGLRLDHASNDRLSWFARYNQAPSRRLAGDDPSTMSLRKFALETDTLTVGLTHTLTQKVVNEIRLNRSRQLSIDEAGVNTADGAQVPPDRLFFPPGYSSKDSVFGFNISPAPFDE